MKVYVLGAAASRHVGYPLASQMAAELLAWMHKSAEAKYLSAATGLSERFGPSPNIEDLISELQARENSLLTDWRCSLVDAVRERFREIRACKADGYAAFAHSIVQAGDVVVTFNYDDSLERELRLAGKWDVRSGYGFGVGKAQPSQTLVLKLHGSINWVAPMFDGRTAPGTTFGAADSLGHSPRIEREDLVYLGYEEVLGHELPYGVTVPALIMPGRKKEFFFKTTFGAEWAAFWDRLWAQAREALKNAKELVLCGYSLLPADERACDLILHEANTKTPVTIVSGDKSDCIAAKFRRCGFSDVRSEQNQLFETWARNIHLSTRGRSPCES